MAILTAGNFYWAGYKPAGRHAAQNPDYVYERGTTLFGSALGIDGGVGGCTGYSWNEAGNWYVQLSGFTNDPANPGGFVDGFYYEDATRTPRTDDNVFFSTLTPDDPGIDGFFPASECLFGGITGGDGAGGGTWDTGQGFAAGVCGGNLNKIFLEQEYSSFRGASFELGNVFGSTFGQQFLGNSANIKIGGFTSMLGRGTTASLLFTNTDGTTAEFLGNTYMFFDGSTGQGFGIGLPFQTTEEGAGLSAGVTLAANQHFIATSGISGSTFATEALYRGLIRGISSGNLKMTIDGSVIPGATLIGITQNIPGVGGNIFLTGNLIGFTFGSAGDFQSTSDINLLGNTLVGGTGEFVGGSKNNTEQPKLSLKTNTLTIRGDSTISLNDSRIDQQLFVLSGAQYNYKNGRINQAIFNRNRIDYLGPARTAASLLDTEVANSLVISGGGFQRSTVAEIDKARMPQAIEPASIGPAYRNSLDDFPNLFFEVNNAGANLMNWDDEDSLIRLAGLDGCIKDFVYNTGFYPGMGNAYDDYGPPVSSTIPIAAQGASYNNECEQLSATGIGHASLPGAIFYGRQIQSDGRCARVLTFTEKATNKIPGLNNYETVDLGETVYLDTEGPYDGDPPGLDWNFLSVGEQLMEDGRMYVKLRGEDSGREVQLLVNIQGYAQFIGPANEDFPFCQSGCSGNTMEGQRVRKWTDRHSDLEGNISVPNQGIERINTFDYINESHPADETLLIPGTGAGDSRIGDFPIEPYFLDRERVTAQFIPVPAERFLLIGDTDGRRPVTYVRPTNTIPNVVIDATRHGNVILEGAATTLDMKPEHEHADSNKQGKVFISKPLNFNTRLDYTTINLKSYNDSQNIAGTKDNNLLILNAGLTIGNLDIGAGTVSVGTNIGDRPITVVKGEMSSKAVLKARSETNPSYQGFKIGDDFTGLTSNAEGILISHPSADIEFSTGHYVLASFADGNTGADTGFQRPGGAIPVPPGSGKG